MHFAILNLPLDLFSKIIVKILSFLAVFLLTCTVILAKQKKKSTYVGVSMTYNPNAVITKTSLNQLSIGMPTFSYGASLEKRICIKNKLNFSLQYSLNYARMDTRNHVFQKQHKFSHSLSLQQFKPLTNKMNAFMGLGLNMNTPNYTQLSYSGCFNQQNKFDNAHTKFDPYAIIGIEKKVALFNKELIYSLQYNLGFLPLIQQRNSTETRLHLHDPNTNGFRVGLKYRY
jgi:hypothetical protein